MIGAQPPVMIDDALQIVCAETRRRAAARPPEQRSPRQRQREEKLGPPPRLLARTPPPRDPPPRFSLRAKPAFFISPHTQPCRCAFYHVAPQVFGWNPVNEISQASQTFSERSNRQDKFALSTVHVRLDSKAGCCNKVQLTRVRSS